MHLEIDGGFHTADDQVAVEHFEAVEELVHVACLEFFLPGDFDGDGLLLGVLHFPLEADLFEVEDDFGHVFDDAGDGRELVLHALYLDAGDCEAFQ